jgi:hypothetical protein
MGPTDFNEGSDPVPPSPTFYMSLADDDDETFHLEIQWRLANQWPDEDGMQLYSTESSQSPQRTTSSPQQTAAAASSDKLTIAIPLLRGISFHIKLKPIKSFLLYSCSPPSAAAAVVVNALRQNKYLNQVLVDLLATIFLAPDASTEATMRTAPKEAKMSGYWLK